MLKIHFFTRSFFSTLTLNGIGRVLLSNFNVTQNFDSLSLQVIKQLCEKSKGFTLVFLARILATIAAQKNSLAQMIHCCQMVFPQAIKDLQSDLLFKQAHVLTHCFSLVLILLFKYVSELRFQLVLI